MRWKSARLAENGGGCNVGEGCGTICEHSLTREQAWQHAAFLRHLRRTSNVREAARRAGVGYGAIQHRRKACPGFPLRWNAADAMAQEAEDGRRTSEKRGS